MQHGIYDSGTKKKKSQILNRDVLQEFLMASIFEIYFELMILHFEYMGFYAYMLAFFRPVIFIASACDSMLFFSLTHKIRHT